MDEIAADSDIEKTPVAGPEKVMALLRDGVRLANHRRYDDAANMFRDALAIDGDNFYAMSNLGSVLYLTGQIDEAAEHLEHASAIDDSDASIRNMLADIRHRKLFGVGLDSYQKTEILRQCLVSDPDCVLRLDMTNLLWAEDRLAAPEDFGIDLSPDEFGHHLLIACMPKSGSSFLFQTLKTLTGFEDLPMSYAYFQNEQEIYLPVLRAKAEQNTVTQQHCRATLPNVHIIQAFGIRPVVLVRNLYDIILSLADFYTGGAIANTFFPGRWDRMDRARQLDLIIDHVMPWYLGFYASWTDAMTSGQVQGMLASYEDMIADKPGTVFAISEFLRLDKTREQCAAAVQATDGNKGRTRFNKGVAGRGERTLDDGQKRRLRRLADYYDDVDFSVVGL